MSKNQKKTLWRVSYRKNTGEDITLGMPSLEDCLSKSKELMTPLNYTIHIEKNEEVVKRWDREVIAGSNKWKRCNPSDFEILGKLITIKKVIKK
ncbi:hypothetical protein I5P92_13835 [Serratia ureilytica]|uniref:type IV pilus biogenesis protein PilI n=1 Tax=Serratia ureilytica TaxID=300181 RepID=UPI0018D71210|nr:hypothetical protein [Serratia ureilytica]MBH3156845.1 hypothetical protein [Serratia ureilytica]MBH3251957.1 hypothetical protein [Serratia ureilytica]